MWKVVYCEEIPRFHEKPASAAERLAAARMPLVLLVIYTMGAFALSFVLFLKYDVR